MSREIFLQFQFAIEFLKTESILSTILLIILFYLNLQRYFITMFDNFDFITLQISSERVGHNAKKIWGTMQIRNLFLFQVILRIFHPEVHPDIDNHI